uniref:Glutamine-dependent NAD(+) synthetase n=1 Tax=Eiseniibacteriota bacterium TaxID=2212470 RepID=A0A832I845_UNCEI
MRLLRIALAQLNPTVGDLDGNFEKAAGAIARARDLGADVLALPEMMITGYPPEDLLLKPSFIERALERTRDLVPLSAGLTVIAGTVDRDGDLYNAAAVLHDGRWAGTYHKHFLPNYGVFDENRYFMVGRTNPVFVRDGTVLGVNVCEDIWYPGGPVEDQVLLGGAEVVINISASPYHAGKSEARRRMMCTRAADNVMVVCFCNLVGGQDEILFDGGSLIVDQHGRVIAEGRPFEEDLVVADVDLGKVFSARLHDPRLRKGRAQEPGEPLPRVALAGAPAEGGGAPLAARAPKPPLEPAPLPPERPLVAEIYDALVLGVRDYVRKNGFETVVLGLSGGVDSAVTAAIAVDALGPAHVVGVLMPSPYTSAASRADAEALARALGMRCFAIPITDVYRSYLRALEPAFEGRPADTTEENLQARIRGNYLMALSNKFGWLVLTTGNKSEMSVGYATLYGDMAGGFAVLKDVYKTTVYELARHRNARGAVIPENTLTRAPSAELKDGQTDQDVLPPYEVLDPILRHYVEDDRAAREIAGMGYDLETVRRVIRMVDAAEYKRRQSPPGVKITPRAFGKDRRLPITSRWRV